MHFGFPKRVLRVLCGYFAHDRRVPLDTNVSDPMSTIMAILPCSKMVGALVENCHARRYERCLLGFFPELKIREYVGRYEALHERSFIRLAREKPGNSISF